MCRLYWAERARCPSANHGASKGRPRCFSSIVLVSTPSPNLFGTYLKLDSFLSASADCRNLPQHTGSLNPTFELVTLQVAPAVGQNDHHVNLVGG